MKMIKSIITITTALAATIGHAGDSAPFRIDTMEGVRIARAEEVITYSTEWDNAGKVIVAVDGMTLKEAVAPASGDVIWNARNASAGNHTLTHTTYKNGVADKVESVTFNWTENPETPPDETDMEWSDGTTTWHYEYIDRNNSDFGIVITGIELSNVTSVQIPSEIGSRIVTKIGTGDPLSGGANLTGVTIPSSVTMIGDSAFSDCANLRSATIAASHIGGGAFAGCETLSNLTISEGVTGIGMYAFEGCSSLTSVTLPSTVRYVDDSAFEYCYSLASVKIKATDARIHKNAFADCGNAFHDYKTIPGLVLVDGWVMGFDENSDRWYNADTIDINFTGARGIASYAFSGCGITSVKIPSSVKCVGECAFEYCGMERVELQASLTAIHRGAFRNNSFTSFAIPGSVQLIGQESFAECGNLKRIEIPGSVVSIGPDAFAGCTSLGDLRLSAGLRQIQSGAFWDCPLTTLSFPDTIVSVEYAFNNIELRSLVIPDSVRYCDQTFIAETATLPAGVDCVDHEAIRSLTITPGTGKVSYLFNSCPNLERVTIQKGVTFIDHAFCECENLKTVSIADGVSHMTASFAGCSANAYDTTTIPGVKLLGGWAMGYTGNLPANLNLKGCRGIYFGAFDGAGLTGVTIPNTVKYIGDYAFVGCNLQSIKIPDSVEEIGYGAFGDDYGLAIFDKTTIKGAVMVDGWIMDCDPDAYGSDGGTLDLTGARGIVNNASLHRLCPVSVYIPSTVSRIPESAFDYCDSLQQIVLAEGVKSIGARAFAGTGISYVVDDSVILCCGMGNSAIVLPSSLTEIGDEAFSECEYLSSVDIAKSNVKTIGQGAFSSPLQRMTLTSKLETLGKLGWSGGGLKVPASVSFVEMGALEGFDLLEFEGNAPVICEIGYGLPTAMVPKDSTGWGVAIPSSTLIYAGGETDKWTVVFDAVGGAVEESSRRVDKGKAVGTLPTPVRAKYKFDGWFTAETGGTKVSATTKVTGNVTFYAHWTYDGSVRVNVTCAGSGSGTVSGADKAYKSGSKASLKATADKQSVFIGWFQDGELLAKTVSYSYVIQGEDDVEIEAYFATKDEDAESLAIDLEDEYCTDDDGSFELNVAECVWSLSEAKVSVKGLPTGLGFDAKTLVLSGNASRTGKDALVRTVCIVVPNLTCEALPNLDPAADAYNVEIGLAFDPALVNCETSGGDWKVAAAGLPAGLKWDQKSGTITGVATKAGAYTVTFTATRGREKQTATITLNVAALPAGAVGVFNGVVTSPDGGDIVGTLQFTSTAAGKLTAKAVLPGGTYSFSAPCWDWSSGGIYSAQIPTGKAGDVLSIEVNAFGHWSENQLYGQLNEYGVEAQRNVFADAKWYFAAEGDANDGWTLRYTDEAQDAKLTATMKADGTVTFAGTLDGMKISSTGCVNVSRLMEGGYRVMLVPVVTVNKKKKGIAIDAMLWLDRSNEDHEDDIGHVRMVDTN